MNDIKLRELYEIKIEGKAHNQTFYFRELRIVIRRNTLNGY